VVSATLAHELDQAWGQLKPSENKTTIFDILYLSYEEVKHGAPKTILIE